MFDFAWTEIALIGVVALVAIGPKDLPVAIKTVAAFIKKARRMAAEFQTHVDDLVREADLHEVRSQINQIRNFDIRGEIEKAVDADGSIRSTLATNPLTTPPPADHPKLEDAAEAAPVPGAETHAGPADQSRNASETRVMERPAETVVTAETLTQPGAQPRAQPVAQPAEPPTFIPPAFIPPGTNR